MDERTSLRSDIIKKVDIKDSSPLKETIMEYMIKTLMEKDFFSRQGVDGKKHVMYA